MMSSRIRSRVAVGLATAVLAAGTLSALAVADESGSASKAHPRGETLQLFEHDTSQANIDLGATGPSPGDQFVFAGDVFDHKGGTKVGRLGGYCTTVSDAEVFCINNFTLPGGQIAVQGLFPSAALFGGQTLTFPITGGAGVYRKARGEGTVQIPVDVPNLTDAYFVLHAD